MALKWTDLSAAEQGLVKKQDPSVYSHIDPRFNHDMHDVEEYERHTYVRLVTIFEVMLDGGVYIILSVNAEHNDDCYFGATDTPIPAKDCVIGIHSNVHHAGSKVDWVEVVASLKVAAEAEYVADEEIIAQFPTKIEDPTLQKMAPWILSLLIYKEKDGYHAYPEAIKKWGEGEAEMKERAPQLFKAISEELHEKLLRGREDNHVVADEAAVSKLNQLLKS